MGIFYWEKAFHAEKKMWKIDFASSEKYSPYASAWLEDEEITGRPVLKVLSPIFKKSAFCFTWSIVTQRWLNIFGWDGQAVWIYESIILITMNTACVNLPWYN